MSEFPDNKLTPVQFEIMQIVWTSENGVTVAEIWESISHSRNIARTTALNLVGRLEKRGWLKRKKKSNVFRYFATVDRKKTAAAVAEKFVDDFFAGSVSELVMSLLGNQKISQTEIENLRQLLVAKSSSSKKATSQ